MFGTNPRPATTNGNGSDTAFNSAPNRLSSDVTIKGDVTFTTELVIDGKVEGNIMSDGRLTIGTHGKVVGDIQVGSVTIQGLVEGDILATDRCALQAGAKLQGDIEAPCFAVDESASFIGSASIKAKQRN
jgi:cytoskeletal protein CcmA (bactofilin family)